MDLKYRYKIWADRGYWVYKIQFKKQRHDIWQDFYKGYVLSKSVALQDIQVKIESHKSEILGKLNEENAEWVEVE